MKEKNSLKKGQASFQFVGEAKINDYTFKVDEQSNSGWIYSVMNLGLDCGNGNTVYCDMMGGYSNSGDSVIYVHGKKENDNGKQVDDWENRFTIDWEDRFDEDILEEVGNQCFITVGLEKDAKGKTFVKKFLSAYDAIEYIKENLSSEIVINVKGGLKYSDYQGTVQMRKEVTSVFLSKIDDPDKYYAKFQQSILVDKDSAGKYDKELGAFPINAYIIDYVGKYGEDKQEIKQNVAFPKLFLFEADAEDLEKRTKFVNKFFKAKKDNVNEITVEGEIVEGQAKINITMDDVPDDIKELVELGAYTEEEALERCAVGNIREKKIVIRKPLVKLVGEGDDKTPVIVKEDEKYKFDDLVFLSQLVGEDDDGYNEQEEEETEEEYDLDDLDDFLNEED